MQPLQLIHHRVASGARTRNFCFDLRGLDEIVAHFHAAGSHHHGTPNGNAPRNRQPMDGKCHALILFNCAPSSAK